MTAGGPLWNRLPDTWSVSQIGRLAEVTLGKMLQPADRGGDFRAPYLRAANVQPDGLLQLEDVNAMWFRQAELRVLNLRTGDVVVVEGGQGGFGRAAFLTAPLDGWGFQNSINRLRPRPEVDGRFVAYYLIALRASGFIRAYCNIVSMPHLTAEKLAAIPIPLPPTRVQRAIADYLDRETAQIDTLIAKQEQLIATLRERRTSTIEHELSISWGTRRLVHAIEFAQTGPFGTQLSATEYVIGGVPIINPTHIKRGLLEVDPAVTVTVAKAEELKRFVVRQGDIVLGRKGDVDKSVLIDGSSAGWLCGSDSMMLRPLADMFPRFLWWFFQSPNAHRQLDEWSVGSTVAGLNQRTIAAVSLPDAPREEQESIVRRLDAATTKVDALIANTERFIELSKERRAALIAAAVTGQIDVRAA